MTDEMKVLGMQHCLLKSLSKDSDFKQGRHYAVESHDLYNVHSNSKHSLVLGPYLCSLNNISVRRVFARFRVGVSALKFYYLRYRLVVHDRDIHYPFCNDTAKTEVHFLLTC